MDDKKPNERDQELEVIRKLRKLLDPLSDKTRDRVMMYLDSYYEDERMRAARATACERITVAAGEDGPVRQSTVSGDVQ